MLDNVSMRNKKNGTLFIQTLIDVFYKYHETCDLQRLLEITKETVSKRAKSLGKDKKYFNVI